MKKAVAPAKRPAKKIVVKRAAPKKAAAKKPAAKKAAAKKPAAKKPAAKKSVNRVTKSAAAAKGRPRAKRGEQSSKLEILGIDGVCDRIEKGNSIGQIADSMGIPRRTAWNWIDADMARSARVRESLKKSATEYDDKAERVLAALKPKSTKAEIARARELAQHYRWRASKRNPKDYGEKIDLNHSGEVKLTDEQLDNRLTQLLRKTGIAEAAGGKAAADSAQQD